MHIASLLLTVGLRDYGTGTWEGGDEGCDHHKPAMDEARMDALTRSSGLTGGPNANNHEYHRGAYAQTCGRCGARRIDSQIGLESSPDEWAARLVDVFREVRRVLRDDGTLWVECGDSYAASMTSDRRMFQPTGPDGTPAVNRESVATGQRTATAGLKPKDLIGQPWLLAFALRADGWYLRSCIIWSKPNAMPESVTDRPTTGHSYVFLFSKRPRYFYDAEALREPVDWAYLQARTGGNANGRGWPEEMGGKGTSASGRTGKSTHVATNPAGRNTRTVWTIPTEPNALAICRICDAYWQGGAPREHCGEPVVQHFAAFPRELVRRMILAGTSERGVCGECGAPWVRETTHEYRCDHQRINNTHPREHSSYVTSRGQVLNKHVTTSGWKPSCECYWWPDPSNAKLTPATVLDPFSGSGTTLLVARSLGRHAVGIELNTDYCRMQKARLAQLSLLAEPHG